MKIKNPDDIKHADNWLYRLYKKRYYKKTIKNFNKELKQVIKEGNKTILYDAIQPTWLLLRNTKLRGAKYGIKKAYSEIEAKYSIGYTRLGTKYFKITQ